MAKSENQKQKLLFVMEYLQRHSHKDHPVKATELIAMLRTHGISADRKSIYSDVEALIAFGLDIVSLKGREGGYYIASGREFQQSELKLLIDAVLSSKYLTEKKSRELIKKLCTLCGTDEDAQLIQRNVMVSGRIKSMNESIYYNVDIIQEAIAKNLQITFRYFDWNIHGERTYREKEYLASPYGLCQDNEHCYLLAYSDRHGITSYRADRMDSICLTKDKRVPCPELTGKNLITYANRRFQMYSGDAVNVKLRFHTSLINSVLDRFGKDIMMIPDGPEHFTIAVNVEVSPMFLSWIIGFGNMAQIQYPASVIEKCRELCQNALNQYL